MWPRTLDMTVDECRVVMRKLEIETYANVISTFRAHGVLDQQRMTILSDLRTILNISQDRHRAETRRATNDEQLTTLADKLFGDDCIIQWTREGKRGAPLLSRTQPYTTVTISANDAANWVRRINKHLPEPATVKRLLPPALPGPLKSPLVLADPLRSAPPHRPVSIVPHLLDDVVQHRIPNLSTRREKMKSGKTKSHRLELEKTKAQYVRPQKVPNYPPATPLTARKPGSGYKKGTIAPTPKQVKVYMPASDVTDEDEFRIEGEEEELMPPQIAKSKKDISSNVKKLNRLSTKAEKTPPPTLITTNYCHYDGSQPLPSPTAIDSNVVVKSVSERGQRRPPGRPALVNKKATSLSSWKILIPTKDKPQLNNNDIHPPPVQVQQNKIHIDQTTTKTIIPSGNGSILFNHLQRKTVPKPNTSSSAPSSSSSKSNVVNGVPNLFGISNDIAVGHEKMATTKTNVVNLKSNNENRISVDKQGMKGENGHLGGLRGVAGSDLRCSRSDGLIEAVVNERHESGHEQRLEVDMGDEEEEEEIVLVEDEEQEVMEITEDKIIFDMNESVGEIIVEEQDELEEVCELEYVVAMDEEPESGNEVIYETEEAYYKGVQEQTRNGSAEDELPPPNNGTDFEYLLDNHAAGTTSASSTTPSSPTSQILVEELDANGYSQIRKANLMELMAVDKRTGHRRQE